MTDNPDIVSPPSSPSGDDAAAAATATASGVSALDPEDQPPPSSQQSGSASSGDGSAQGDGGSSNKSAGVLRRYIENFDQQTMIDTARLVSDVADLWPPSRAPERGGIELPALECCFALNHGWHR